MSKQVISIDGQDRMVREDTAKSFRGTHWALVSLCMFIVIALALLLAGVIKINLSGDSDKPLNAPYSQQ